MNRLIELLEESADLYKSFLDLEYRKYDTVVKNDIVTLDDIVAQEQAYYLKMRGIEQKREKLVNSMGYNGKTLKEIAEEYIGIERNILKEKYNELDKIIIEVKKINSLCKTLIEVRMNRINKAMTQLGEKENTYTNMKFDKKAKSMMLSKNI